MRSGAGRDSGFVLIELLVAVALLGLVAAMISGVLRQTARLNVAGEARLGAAARINAVQSLLRRQIEGSLPVALPVADSARRQQFFGSPTSAAWIIRRPSQALPGGLYMIRLAYRASANREATGVLLASWQRIDPALPPDGQRAPVETMRLVEYVRRVRFAFYGSKRSGGTGWHEDWEDAEGLPRLISLQLDPAGNADWNWPHLIAAPQIAFSSSPTASVLSAEE